MRHAFSEEIKIDYGEFSICECWMTIGMLESGVGRVIIARKDNDDNIILGEYFIDIFCLGMNDFFVRSLDLGAYQDIIKKSIKFCSSLELVEPVFAKTFIHKFGEHLEKFCFERPAGFVKGQGLLEDFSVDQYQDFHFEKIVGRVA